MSERQMPANKGRGSSLTPPNRFLDVRAEFDAEHFEFDPDEALAQGRPQTTVTPDLARSVVSENNSPDLPFRFSLNPYRGCEHGCAYCYARPTHEYLGLNAGIDFESRLFVKEQAPALFRKFLASDRWQPQRIMLSGVTDCYQPIEREYRLTRGCLEVALEARQPISLITKNALIVRDLDLLEQLASRRHVQVAISLTTLDEQLARTMEPRTSRPVARLRAIGALRSVGVPVRGMLAPIIPGLNDHELPALLAAVAEAGATSVGYTLLRLPLTVAPVFMDWLTRTHPAHAARIEGLIRGARGGDLSSSTFGERMRGTGPLAQQIEQTFRVFSRRYGLDLPEPELDFSQFRAPTGRAGQKRLF
ncbi:MAG: PA0069 family radical SAM protein [Planctomycetales bacterium]